MGEPNPAVVFGLVALAMASMVSGGVAIVSRAILIALLLLVTTPVNAHAIGRAAYVSQQRMETPDPVNESDRPLRSDVPPWRF